MPDHNHHIQVDTNKVHALAGQPIQPKGKRWELTDVGENYRQENQSYESAKNNNAQVHPEVEDLE